MAGWLGERDAADSTPLDEEEREGLLLSWVATRGELNAAEQENIISATVAWRRRRWRVETLLDDMVARRLHRDMLGDVWAWAGKYRLTEKTIGIDPWQISVSVRDLMEDAKLWFTGPNPMATDRAACRFHHRLVRIHPFPNGNGRHAREMTDLLLLATGTEPFTWGRVSLTDESDTRSAYIGALRQADMREFADLENLVRT